MEQVTILLGIMLAAHVFTVYFITRSHKQVVEEFRQVVLERELTERQYYTISSTEAGTDTTKFEVV